MAGGINAQYGFIYQKHVFILMVLQTVAADTFFTYEGIDDIDIDKSETLHLLTTSNPRAHIQVKSGNIDENSMIRVIGNWMNMDSFSLDSSLTLYAENTIPFEYADNKFAQKIIAEFKQGQNRKKGSIMRTAYDKYSSKLSDPTFEQYIVDLLNTITVEIKSHEAILKEIFRLFEETYCGDIKIFNLAKVSRQERFISYISDLIDVAISEKSAFVLKYNQFISLIQKVTNEISDKKYKIDVSATKKKMRPEAEKIVEEHARREVQQLCQVDQRVPFVIEGIIQEMLYQEFREVYAENDSVAISNIEQEAKDNYDEVMFELDSSEQTPKKIYFSTTKKNIAQELLPSSIYAKGCYIHLTGDNIEEELQITWGEYDEEE